MKLSIQRNRNTKSFSLCIDGFKTNVYCMMRGGRPIEKKEKDTMRKIAWLLKNNLIVKYHYKGDLNRIDQFDECSSIGVNIIELDSIDSDYTYIEHYIPSSSGFGIIPNNKDYYIQLVKILDYIKVQDNPAPLTLYRCGNSVYYKTK
jgi:hypothetical protein